MSETLDLTPAQGPLRVRLRDGAEADLRPLARHDTETVQAVFDGMSEQSRALRYLTGLPRLPGTMRRMLSDVDDDRHVAWVACIDGRPVGLARYIRLAEVPATAELALEVVDRDHGRGLGTLLLDAVTTVAAARGVRRVRATMAPGNTASRHLIERVGGAARLGGGLLEADGELRLLDPPVVDRAAVLAVAAGPRGRHVLPAV
ncbi:MAG TPA: GNAT family N-acetyltransferase [Nocardioidaceae bacterium]